MINMSLEPSQGLFETKAAVSKSEMKAYVTQDVKSRYFSGIAESELFLEDLGEDAILVKKLDPDKAQGQFTYDSEDDYFTQLDASMRVPTARELGMENG